MSAIGIELIDQARDVRQIESCIILRYEKGNEPMKGTMIVSGMSNEDMVLIHTQLKLIHRLRVIAGRT